MTTKNLQDELVKSAWNVSLMTRTKKAQYVERVRELRTMQQYTDTKKTLKVDDMMKVQEASSKMKAQEPEEADSKMKAQEAEEADSKMKKLKVDDVRFIVAHAMREYHESNKDHFEAQMMNLDPTPPQVYWPSFGMRENSSQFILHFVINGLPPLSPTSKHMMV